MNRQMAWGLGMLAMVLAAAAGAQGYPHKTVRIIVPYPPGGGTDITARPIAQRLSEKWGQQVVIDNRGGATGMIGGELAAKSSPDGYTLLIAASSEVSLNAVIFAKMPYDPVKAFTSLTLATITPTILVTHPSLPVKSVKEYIALAASRPGQLSYASVGTGSPQHFAGELLKLMARINLIHVPFKGAGPAIIDLLGGHVPSGFVALLPVIPHIKAGKLRGLAVSSAKRSPSLPEVPSLAESGFPGFDIVQWFSAWAPAGTPKEIVDKVAADMIEIIKSPDYQKRMVEQGTEAVGSTPAELGAFQLSEIEKYRNIVKQARMKVE